MYRKLHKHSSFPPFGLFLFLVRFHSLSLIWLSFLFKNIFFLFWSGLKSNAMSKKENGKTFLFYHFARARSISTFSRQNFLARIANSPEIKGQFCDIHYTYTYTQHTHRTHTHNCTSFEVNFQFVICTRNFYDKNVYSNGKWIAIFCCTPTMAEKSIFHKI